MEYRNQTLRHELKFYINYHEYTYLKNRLKDSLILDENSSLETSDYTIRSLYFDDVYNSALKEKEAGVFQRKKYRVRIYNGSDSVIKFEKKSKYNKYITKKSKKLSKKEFYKLINGKTDFLIKSKNKLLNEVYVETKTKLLKPVVIVTYEREAYTYPLERIRITFDKNLRAGIKSYDVFDENLIEKDIFDKQIMIMEIKYNSYLPSFIKNLLQMRKHTHSAISKYVLCRKTGQRFI